MLMLTNIQRSMQGAILSRAKPFYKKTAFSCHASSFGGDGSAIYTRENQLVKTSRGLKAQVRNCNTMLGLKWFEDEELHVASYLNQTYYHFEK